MNISTASILLSSFGWISRGTNIWDFDLGDASFNRIALYPDEDDFGFAGVLWANIVVTENGFSGSFEPIYFRMDELAGLLGKIELESIEISEK